MQIIKISEYKVTNKLNDLKNRSEMLKTLDFLKMKKENETIGRRLETK